MISRFLHPRIRRVHPLLYWGSVGAVLLIAGAIPFQSQANSPNRPAVTIGVLFDGPPAADPNDPFHFSTRRHFEMFRDEIITLTRREFDVRFPEKKRISGQWSKTEIQNALDGLMEDAGVDLILTMGYFSTIEACRHPHLAKPVVAPFGIDIKVQRLPLREGTSGVRNLNYTSQPGSAYEQLVRFQELIGFERIHVIHDPLILDFIPKIYDYFQEGTRALGFEAIPHPAQISAAETLAALPPDTEAVYVTLLPRMPLSEFDRLISGLKARRLPSFALVGRRDVELGILAGVAPASSPERLARRVALNVQRILLGEEAGTLPVLIEHQERLVLNMETARAIGWSPTWQVLTQSEQLHPDDRNRGRRLTLAEAATEALEKNLQLAATQRAVKAGEEEVNEAVSLLRPQVELSTQGTQIDEDRAQTSLGASTERVWSGSATLSQIIYSDEVSGNVEVERQVQESREFDLDRVRLDIALEAAIAFLNVLRTQSLAEVQRDNLRLTEVNLDIARRRQELGVAGPAEVYRFESQLARDQRELNAARQDVEAARSSFNRVLHLPQNEPFIAEPPSLDDPTLLTGHGRLRPYVTKLGQFRIFSEFAVKTGLERSPEIKTLDAAIRAQERVFVTARRDYWAPDVKFFGDVSREIAEGGIGADDPSFPRPASGETDWTAGITVSLPLFQGGARAARLRGAQEELTRLRLERDATAEAIELRIRSALYGVASSYPAIKFNRDSAEAARRNLDLVADQYSSGVVSIIDLLDAQNNALQADELAASSVYDFLVDLMELQRAMSSFGFLMTEAEREEWFGEVEDFFRKPLDTGPNAGR